MGTSCALLVQNTKVISRSHQNHFRVKLAKDIGNVLCINFKLVSGAVIYLKGLMVTHSWQGIISTYIFRKSRSVSILGGVLPPGLPILHPFPQGSIEQAKLQVSSSG